MLRMFEMNDVEVKILEEVKNGRTEFLFSNKINDMPKEELQGIYMLISFGYIQGEDYSDEDKLGYINLTLTDKGKCCFVDGEGIENYY
ncbi:hypothetical protein [Lysinibacillus sp. FSL P2-0066]|uniref:hypothetical protein n=1 Tax=Lysinibacillus sp. FSL P2-0066 TaxID=2921720 RepID=UPI0030DD1AE4